MTSLAEVLQRVSTAAYQAASAAGDSGNGTSEGGAGESGDETGEGAGDGAPADEETVEGEFKEV
jgi:hypothetical protein